MKKCINKCQASLSRLAGALGFKFLIPSSLSALGLSLSSSHYPSTSCLWDSSQIRAGQIILDISCDIMRFVEIQCGISLMYRVMSSGCPQGFYGRFCRRRCNCPNNGRCHRLYGGCLCTPGKYGKFCHLRKYLVCSSQSLLLIFFQLFWGTVK